jgi:hypothetical protein
VKLRLLVSYHYHRSTDLADLVAGLGGDVDLFADSGAYSAATSGATIRLPDYAAWLHQWAPLFTVQAGLDIIGDHEATARNTAASPTPGARCCPPSTSARPGRSWRSCAPPTGTSPSAGWPCTPSASQSNGP